MFHVPAPSVQEMFIYLFHEGLVLRWKAECRFECSKSRANISVVAKAPQQEKPGRAALQGRV